MENELPILKKLAMPINIVDVLEYIPHRYPFLLVDRVLSVDPGKKITMLKNVTTNEHFFVGHFVDYPVMPGVLIVEAMAQAAGVLMVLTHGPRKPDEIYFFAAINNARFKRQVIPGDTLILEIEMLRVVRGVSKYTAKALVDGVVAAEAELLIAKKQVTMTRKV